MHYFWRQLVWIVLSVPVMLGVSMLPVATGAAAGAVRGGAFHRCCWSLVPLIGSEMNGARRWIGLGIVQFQPSEFLKPLFIVAIAWMLSLRAKDHEPAGGAADRRADRA